MTSLRFIFRDTSIHDIAVVLLLCLLHALFTSVSLIFISALFEILAESGEPATGFISGLLIRIASFTGVQPAVIAVSAATGVVLTGSIVGFLKTWRLAVVLAKARDLLSRRLLKICAMDETWFINKQNLGSLKSLVLEETGQVVKQLFHPALDIVASGIFLTTVIFVLLWVEPITTIVLSGTIGGAYLICFLAVKSRMHVHGVNRFKANSARYGRVDDVFNLRLLAQTHHNIEFLLKGYSEPSSEMARRQYLFDTIAGLPKIIVEGLIFLLIIAGLWVTFVSGADDENIGEALKSVLLFGLAGIKLLPETQRLFNAVGMMKFGGASQLGVQKVLEIEPNGSQRSIYEVDSAPADMLFKVRNLSVRYGEQTVVESADVTIARGDMIAVSGRSGSGKSSLVSGLLGHVEYDCLEKLEVELPRGKVRWGILPQETRLINGSIWDNILMGNSYADSREIFKTAQRLFPEFDEGELKDFLNRVISNTDTGLSIGQKQRLGMLRCCVVKPSILILDEFTSALDAATEEILIDFVFTEKFYEAAIIIGHREKTLQRCNKMWTVSQGKVTEETIAY